MAQTLTADDGRESLREHVAAKGEEIHQAYPYLGWTELRHLLENRHCTRYPCELAFDAAGLQPGEFAHAEPKGDRPEEGFRLAIHPFFQNQLDKVPLLALYHLVAVNYGEFASAEDAEVFGAAALGLEREDYYTAVCRLADQLDAALAAGLPPAPEPGQAKKCCEVGKI